MQRAGDFIARYGGEEFVALVPSADFTAAVQLAEILRRRVERLAIPHEHADASNVVTVSVGATSVVAVDDIDPSTLIAAADRQLYAAKGEGPTAFPRPRRLLVSPRCAIRADVRRSAV